MAGKKIPQARHPYATNEIGNASFSAGAQAANARNVAIQLQDYNLYELAQRGCVFGYLSDDAGGDSLAATAPTGGWAIGTDGLLIPKVANKAADFVSESDGDIDVTITEAGQKSFWMNLVLPDGRVVTSDEIAFTTTTTTTTSSTTTTTTTTP